MSKTHYRKVFKSDHLGSADLEDMQEEGSNLIFTISHVRQEINVTVAGKKGSFNIAYFKEKIKPLVVNAVNSMALRRFSGNSPFVEDWKDITVQLYIDPNVNLKGQTVSGVRISHKPPKLNQGSVPQKEAISDERLVTAIAKINAGEYTVERLNGTFALTTEQSTKVSNEVKKA
jgi:hypothetical protein